MGRQGSIIFMAGSAFLFTLLCPLPASAFQEKNIGVGLNLNRGNSDSLTASLVLDGRRKREASVLDVALRGSYGKTDDRTTAERIGLTTDFQRDVSSSLYWVLSGGFERDRVADLDYRLDTGIGFGRYLLRDEKTTLSLDGGLGWVNIRYRSEPRDDYFSLRFAQRFEKRFENAARLWQSLRWFPEAADPGTFLALFETGLEAPFTGRSSLRLVFQNNYNSKPAPGKKKNDLALISYLAWRF